MPDSDPAAMAIGLVTAALTNSLDTQTFTEFSISDLVKALGYVTGVLAGTLVLLAEERGVDPLELWAGHALYHAQEATRG